MAGSSSNWYKNPKAGAKGSIYVSRAEVADFFNIPAVWGVIAPEQGRQILRDYPDVLADLIGTFNPQPPTGAAKSGGARIPPPIDPPAGWAQDERAQALIAAQEAMARGGDAEPLASFDREMRDAFRKSSPRVGIMADIDYEDGDFTTLPEEYLAVVMYTLEGFQDTNATMWDRSPDASRDLGDFEDSVLNIQQTLLRGKAPFDMTVTRTVNEWHPLAKWGAAAEPGDSYINQGFDSSSLDPEISLFGDGMSLRMRIPEGSHGAYINSIFPTNTQYTEYEWLIPANGTWVVSGKTVDEGGKIEITVDLVDQRTLRGGLVWPQDTRKSWQT